MNRYDDASEEARALLGNFDEIDLAEMLASSQRDLVDTKAALVLLHEGEEPYDDERIVPTPAQWIWQWNRATPEERLSMAELIQTERDRLNRCTWDGHEHQIGTLRETNRRLNYRCQNAEHVAAVFKRAVDDWEWNDKGTYVPLRSLHAIAKAVGLKFDGDKLEHHIKRVERLQEQVKQLTALCQTGVTAGAIGVNGLRAALGMPEASEPEPTR